MKLPSSTRVLMRWMKRRLPSTLFARSLLDIRPEVSAQRKQSGRDKYEQDLDLLARVRNSYLRQAAAGWVRVDADRDRNLVATDVYAAVEPLIRRT